MDLPSDRQMDPEIKWSVRKLSQSSWALGSSVVCQKNGTPPTNVLKAWSDGEDQWYIGPSEGNSQAEPNNTSKDVELIHAAGTSAAVWSLGTSIICKTKAWVEGLQSEADTISFVKGLIPDVTVPEVLYAWVDESWNRSFIVERRITGTTLDEAWSSLRDEQKKAIAHLTGQICRTLAQSTSQLFETASHSSIVESFFGSRRFDSPEPSWKPCMLEIMSVADFEEFSTRFFDGTRQSVGEAFLFYHADLGPGNIMVHDGRFVGIIDWESAGYFPEWWIATKPQMSAGFLLKDREDGTDRAQWATMLSEELQQFGFQKPEAKFVRQKPAL